MTQRDQPPIVSGRRQEPYPRRRSSDRVDINRVVAGGGDTGELIRSMDWAKTPLGPVEAWPQSLLTAISMMLESRFAMVVAWGPEFRFFYNDRYRPVLGATKHPNALGSPAQQIFPEAWPFIGPLFAQTRAGESVALDDQLIPLDRNGYLENCYFTLSYSPIRDESGGVGGMLAVVAETTEHVQGRRRLGALRDLLRAAADAKTAETACETAARIFDKNGVDVPFALLYLVAEDGKSARLASASGMTRGTPACPTQIDLTSANPQGWPVVRVVRSRKLELIADIPSRFGPLPGGPYPEPTHAAVIAPLAKPGQPHPYAILIAGVSPRRAFDDAYRGFFDLAADHVLSAIANARAFLREHERAEALAEIDRAKTVFFSNVSHEFRTPLTLMLGPVVDLLAGAHGTLTAAQREPLELLHRNALRLQKLVNALLDFSRIEAGRIEAAYEPVDLAALTRDLASVFRSAVEKAGLTFTITCPPLDAPVHVDRDMWEKIVLNLISNAFKFTFEGGIEVSLRAEGHSVALRVTDTGVGVPEAEVPRLFDRFHRAPRTRARTHEGSGIGLALVQELAKLHGGSIRAESTLGAGTTLTVTIPKGSSHLPEERIRAARTMAATALGVAPFVEEALGWLPEAELRGGPEAQVAPEGRAAERVLVADDNADMRRYIRGLLEPHWAVEVVEDGAKALAAALERPPDLILTDVMMPGVDGFQLIHSLREDERTRTIPVVMLSARAGEEAKVEGLAAGADDYVIKPFAARELVMRVRSQLELSRLRRDAERKQERSIEELQQTIRLSELFAGILGHDLRNPLNTISTAASLLSRRAESEAIATPASLILKSSDRMARMVDQLLDFTRIRLGRGLLIQPAAVDLSEICRAVIDELVTSQGCSIQLEEAGDLAGRWDRDQLCQLLSNLVGNACQHRRANTAVLVRADGTQASAVRLDVWNEGMIDAELLPVIFEPLHEGRGKKRTRSSGVGLGLYISQQIVVGHRGTIRVESSEEQGTRFVVELPRSSEIDELPGNAATFST